MSNPSILLFATIGGLSGALSALFGIGGGVIIVPALIYLAGFNQHLATGTSLAVLLPPVGVGAAVEYYRQGNVDVRAAVVIAAAMLVCGWLVAGFANRAAGQFLRILFGLFVTGLGLFLVYDATRQLSQ
jgi:uncharacterized membrane protein YfcA